MGQQELLLQILNDAYTGDLYRPPVNGASTKEPALFRFIDLFAGIGGFRLALEKNKGQCVFSSEWDVNSQKTYKTWFNEIPHGDITKIDPITIPDHEILAAGFPCQPFSIAGVSKKKSLGRPHGFDDVAQGNLFFNLASIVEVKRPPVLLLENVKNLRSHDGGRTWTVIREKLESLNYWAFNQIIDAADWVPQHRERIYIVCFDKKRFPERPDFQYPLPPAKGRPRLADILDHRVDDKYTLTDNLWKYLQKYAEKHREKGNGFGFSLAPPEGVTRTLSARYYKDGSEILISQGRNKNPRRLTPTECARLMGFPSTLKIAVSDTQAYRQFGNAVVPKVVDAILQQILKVTPWKTAKAGSNGHSLKEKRKLIRK